MRVIQNFAAIVVLTIFMLPVVSATEIYMQARVFFDSPTQIDQLRRLHLDQVWQGKDYIEIVTDKEELGELESLGFKTEIVYEDLTAFFKSRFDKVTGFLSLAQIEQEMIFLQIMYPDIVGNRVSIGQTLEGRNIWALKVSDNPAIDEDEPEILFTGCIHAREGITPLVLLNFIEHLGDNYGIDPEITDLVDNREIWIVLVVNPDGYAYNDSETPGGGGMWRKNRRDNGDGSFGVDLNRNFGHMWGYDDIGSSPVPEDATYRGTGPFSEAETQALRDFTIAHNFVITLYFHSYSNIILFPWSYDVDLYTPDHHYFMAMGNAIGDMNGYDPGPGWFLYPTNGDSDDWNYGEQTLKDKCYGMTVEIGNYLDNFWPATSRINQLIQENLEPCLYLTWAAGNIDAVLTPEIPVLTAPDSVDISTAFDLDWLHDDTLNPAIEYQLVEMTGRSRVVDDVSDMDNWDNNGFELSYHDHSYPRAFYSGFPPSPTPRSIQTKHPYHVNPGDTLKFWTTYGISQYWDFAYVEVSTDGGVNFNSIPGNITTDSDPYGGHNRGHGITGWTEGYWIEGLFDLSEFVGENIYIRFSYKDHDTVYSWWDGIYIDDIYPVMQFENSSVIASGSADTSFTVPGKPEDIYYYKVRALDADGQWSGYSDYSKVVVGNPQEYLCGDANGDGLLNVPDLVYLAQYILSLGPEPLYFGQGDVDECGDINISDVAYLLRYTYYSGPAPCEGSVTCDPPSDGNQISLGCPVRKPTTPEDDSVAVPVYMTNNTDLLAFTIGFECDNPAFEILSFDATGTELPNPSMIHSNIISSENQILLTYYETPGIISSQTDALIGNIWVRVPGGAIPQAVDFDSAFVGQAGEFIFSPMSGGSIHPTYVDCGVEDIVVLPEYICGDADGNLDINILDITYLISYLYKGGPPPEPLEAGDANGDGPVNILDITYLINYLYKGGPDPVCP